MRSRAETNNDTAMRTGRDKPTGPNGEWRDYEYRRILAQHGYNVSHTGGYNARVHSAWMDYIHAGRNRRDAKQSAQLWNKSKTGSSVTLDGSPVSDGPKHGGPYKSGPVTSSKYGKGKQPKGDIRSGVGNAVDQAGKSTDTHARAKAHAHDLGAKGHTGPGLPGIPSFGTDVNKLLPESYADKLAALQFDPALNEARLQIGEHGRDTAQALQNIGDWGKQVSDAQATAGTRDAEAGTRARGDVSAVLQGIVQSLGQRGGALVGATGANDLTALAGEGQAQDQYNADVGPILARGTADSKARQQAISSQADEKLQASLIDLQGQKGSAKAQALMQIIQANNASRQSNFGNRVSLQNAALAASSLGLDAAKTQAMLEQYGLQNAYTRARTKAVTKGAGGSNDWHTLTLPDRQKVIGDAIKAGLAGLPQGAPWDPGHVQNSALAYLRTYGGYGSARKLGFKGKVPSKRNQGEILSAINQAITAAGQSYGKTPGA